MWGSPSGLRIIRVVTGLLVLTALPAMAASIEKPETFVRRVYARYRTDGPGLPMERPGGSAFYTGALLDAFAKDSALANGEIGAIDSDPICVCQDYENLRVTAVAIENGEADTVKARVKFTNLQYHETVTLTLSRTAAGWRIADVGSQHQPSIMALIRDSIAHPIRPSSVKPSPLKP